MTCPCYECEFRRPGCHGSCEPFKTWRAPLDGLREEKERLRKIDDVLQEGIERRRKWARSNGRKK